MDALQALPDEEIATRAPLARAALLAALTLGILANALLHDGLWGIGAGLWIVLVAAVVVALVWRRGDRIEGDQLSWMIAAIFFACMLAWRDEESLRAFDIFAVILCAAMLGMSLARSPVQGLFQARVRDLLLAVASAVMHAIAYMVPLVVHDADLGRATAAITPRRSSPYLRAALITVPVVIVFGALLRAADPMFAALVRLPTIDLEAVMPHIVMTGFFTWIIGGWLRGAIVAPASPASSASRRLITLGGVEITTVLGALAVLFTLFIGVQLRWMFGGEAIVRQTTGLGYADYARRGFFELVWVALLTLPLLLVVNASIADSDRTTRRRFQLLGTIVLLLVGAVVASALSRMSLYVRYYGLSIDRLNATAIMMWIALVLALFAVTVLRDRPRTFAAGMALSGFGMLALLNILNPAHLVARVNIERGSAPAGDARTPAERPIDFAYLARRGGDAVPLLVPALLASTAASSSIPENRCTASRMLLEEWADYDDNEEVDWRRWNASRARAREIVRSKQQALRKIPCPKLPTLASFALRAHFAPAGLVTSSCSNAFARGSSTRERYEIARRRNVRSSSLFATESNRSTAARSPLSA